MKVESLPTQKSSTQHSFTADVEIVDENWVTIDSEIVNATPVVANSEIGSGDEFFFLFYFFPSAKHNAYVSLPSTNVSHPK
jgi:hypothetical protein